MAVAATAAWPVATLIWCRSVTTSPAGIEAFHRGALPVVDMQVADIVAAGAKRERELRSHLAA